MLRSHDRFTAYAKSHTNTYYTTTTTIGTINIEQQALVCYNNYIKCYSDPEAAIYAEKRNLCPGKKKEWRDFIQVVACFSRLALSTQQDDTLYKYQKKKEKHI